MNVIVVSKITVRANYILIKRLLIFTYYFEIDFI